MTFSLLSETLEVKQIVLIVFNFLTQRNVSLNHPKLRFQNHKSRALSKQLHFPVLSFVFDVIWVYTPPTNLKNSHFAIIELTTNDSYVSAEFAVSCKSNLVESHIRSHFFYNGNTWNGKKIISANMKCFLPLAIRKLVTFGCPLAIIIFYFWQKLEGRDK